LTAYEYDSDGTWQSVVATGSLQSLSNDAVANWAAAIFFTQASNIETASRREDSDTKVEWYEYDIETLTGRTNTGGDSNESPPRLE